MKFCENYQKSWWWLATILFIKTLVGKELTGAVRTFWFLLCVILFHLFAVFAQLFPHLSSLLGDLSDWYPRILTLDSLSVAVQPEHVRAHRPLRSPGVLHLLLLATERERRGLIQCANVFQFHLLNCWTDASKLINPFMHGVHYSGQICNSLKIKYIDKKVIGMIFHLFKCKNKHAKKKKNYFVI